ncbi:MAG: cation transporter [Acidobacteria bacterium]|nr:cation transporter [Acidobacteriota bacterium]
MQKTTFVVPQMDCPSEESLIRLQLDGLAGVRGLDFDLPGRRLVVFHDGQLTEIEQSIAALNLGSRRLGTEEADSPTVEEDAKGQRSLLLILLAINFAFFIVEMATGLVSRSMGLVADSLDMLADAFVYGLSLFAVGGTAARKRGVARLAGYFQIALAVAGFAEVLRRFFGGEATPDSRAMIVVSVLALVANAACLYLLQKSKSEEAHMRATMIFTSNDVVINLGVIAAGVLVSWFDSNRPDLIVGAIVFGVVMRGAVKILKLGK